MSSTRPDTEAQATGVRVSDDFLTVCLDDGREISAPLSWYPRLLHATPRERGQYRLIGRGFGVHWPDLDEDIAVEHLLEGRPSAESERSLRRWLSRRQSPKEGGRSSPTGLVDRNHSGE